MDGSTLATLYRFTERTYRSNLADLDEDLARRAPEDGGNSINWLVGHIIATRDELLEILGGDTVLDADERAPYLTGTEGLTDDAGLPLSELQSRLKESGEEIERCLSGIDVEHLDDVRGENTLAEIIIGFGFHESYHAGQIGLVRRAIGLAGTIG